MLRLYEKHSPIACDVYHELKKKNPNADRYLGSFGTTSDHTCEPLQAADAAIYEVRRALHTSLGKWKESLKWNANIRWQFRKFRTPDMPPLKVVDRAAFVLPGANQNLSAF